MSLIDELKRKREELKTENYNYDTMRRPPVCTDESLYLLNYFKPSTIEEMRKIGGIGPQFIEKYAEDFLPIINKHNVEKPNKMKNEEKEVMEKLKNRLVFINKRNRMLYSGKINKNFGVDLYKISEDFKKWRDIIFHQSTAKHILFDLKYNSEQELINESLYKNIIKVFKEYKRNEIETGNTDLYIAYPYLQGKLENDDFNIKAPLVLFPVKLERTNESILIQYDDERDVVYNTNLILANNKANGKNVALPDNLLEDLDEEHFLDKIISFFNSNELYIKESNKGPKKFFENKREEFPNYANGNLEIVEYMVLGIFPSYMTSMHKDFQKMLETQESTDLIKELISSISVSDDSKIEFSIIEDIDDKKTDDKKIEDSIDYINELNYSQEKVLEKIEQNTSLVVQGPPGTGKSQTITSLIIQSVLRDKKVLMVSEKKAALDVIYSRLGKMADYAVMIDDTENKEDFYKQIKKILSVSTLNSDVESIKANITQDITVINTKLDRLQEIANKVFMPGNFGIALNELYFENEKYDFLDEKKKSTYEYLKENINPTLLLQNYSDIKKLKICFEDDKLLMLLKFFQDTMIKYPWNNLIRKDLTDYQISNFLSNFDDYKKYIINYLELPFYKKIFYKNELKKKTIILYDEIIRSKEDYKELTRLVLKNIDEIYNFISLYNQFCLSKVTMDNISNHQQLWFLQIYDMSIKLEVELKEANELLYNHLLYIRIEEFEKNNMLVINDINYFDSLRIEIERAICNKKDMTKDLALQKLNDRLLHLNYNRNIKEIERRSNLKRNNSVNKFIEMFKFELFDSISIWLMTPEVVSDLLPLQKELFDIVIFDEASQMYVEKGIPAIYRTKKVVVAGDTQQLKPSSLGTGRIIDEEDEELGEFAGAVEEESLLGLAQYRYERTMLNYHYRSNYEELIAFSNYAFYEGKLYVSPNVNTPKESPIERIMVSNGRWINKQNIEEARETVSIIKKVLTNRKADETIGVITFNITQRDLIEDLLEEEMNKDSKFAILVNAERERKKDNEDISLFVKNIENVQGDERDIIIFSIGYARNESDRVAINFGWLSQNGGENRLNVAISRAKKKIYVVTSIEPEELQIDDTKNKGPKLFRKYLEYVKAINDNDKVLARSILLSLVDSDIESGIVRFDSEFEEEVYGKLVERGVLVDSQVGVGGYSIDLAIKNKSSNEYILGIECDGKLYHSSPSARERDYHRQKYLESRGWKIYRIWSTNWWKDSNKEIEKILHVVENIK